MSDEVLEICGEFYAKLPIKIGKFTVDTDGNGGLEITETVSVKKKETAKKEKAPLKYAAEIEEIVAYLNEVGGTKFRTSTPKTQTLITAKLDNKYTVENFKKVIDTKYSTWKDNEYIKYFCPETLFGNKFEKYFNEIPVSENKSIVCSDEHSYSVEAILEASWKRYN